MSDQVVAALYVAEAVQGLTAAVYYLSYAVSTLAVVGLIGYWVALRAARNQGS